MSAPGRLSCLTLNLWGDQAPRDRRMEIVAGGLAAMAPDVVALQEVREGPDCPNQAETLARATGYEMAFAPAVAFRGGHEGLAILSRTPIVERVAVELPHATEQERRILLSVRVMTPTGDTWVHTTHLNYRLSHGQERQDQVL